MAKKVYKRYSEAFRIQVVREYEKSGASLNALRKKYGVSIKTLKQWIKRYSREGVREELMIIQSPEEQNRIKELEGLIRQQERVIAQLSLDKLMLESTVTVLEREYGIEAKKNEPRSSQKPTKTKGR